MTTSKGRATLLLVVLIFAVFLGCSKPEKKSEPFVINTGARTLTDNINKLEWLFGPDKHTSYASQSLWIKNNSLQKWRMPTHTDLELLYTALKDDTPTAKQLNEAFGIDKKYIWCDCSEIQKEHCYMPFLGTQTQTIPPFAIKANYGENLRAIAVRNQ